jgi:putative iron-only hydrogenase system regulator
MDRIGSVVIIIKQREEAAPKINAILSDYSDIILARVGLPFKEKRIHVINLIINGTTDEIGALTGKIGRIPGVTVKSILSKD